MRLADNLQNQNEFCGLLLDEWTETIPEKEETSGIAFHYDQPNAKAPQAMLLVTPQNGSSDSNPHTYQHFIDSIDHTLRMMKLRLVEPDHFSHSTVDQ